MEKLFLSILNMSLTASFVVIAIMLARVPLKKAPKGISYALWAVAGFRLVFPFSIESALSLMPIKAQSIPLDIAMQPVPRIDSGVASFNHVVSSVLPAATPAASANPLQIWLAIGGAVWILGIAIMLIYSVVSIILLKRNLRGAILVEGNLYEADNLRTPFVIGFFKPKIYIPAALSGEERSYIILHEQMHIRRHDHVVKMLAYFVLCLHWFNPLVWAAFILMGADMEMSCDERVMKTLGGEIKRDYSRSLVTMASRHKILNGSPLAFGEGGMKERVKNVLNFKKPSRMVIVAAVMLAAAVSVGFALNKTIGMDFPMQGANLSDIQTEEIIRHIAQATKANDESIIVPQDNFELHVSSTFDLIDGGAISMLISKEKADYACQLRIFSDEGRYFITEPQLQDTPEERYLLWHYLDALKYLPQEDIRSLVGDDSDGYIITFRGGGILDDSQPCVFYDMNGLTTRNSGWFVSFDILPIYMQVDGTEQHARDADVIHVFYGDASAQVSVQTYSLDSPTDRERFERMLSVSLYEDGTAVLAASSISSYLLPPCVYSFEGDELIIYADIESSEWEGAYGVKNGDTIAVFTVAADGALIFKSAEVPLYADEGARYIPVASAPATDFVPGESTQSTETSFAE